MEIVSHISHNSKITNLSLIFFSSGLSKLGARCRQEHQSVQLILQHLTQLREQIPYGLVSRNSTYPENRYRAVESLLPVKINKITIIGKCLVFYFTF